MFTEPNYDLCHVVEFITRFLLNKIERKFVNTLLFVVGNCLEMQNTKMVIIKDRNR